MPARVLRKRPTLAVLFAFASLACSPFREAQVRQPVVMAPMADATLRAGLARVFVTSNVVLGIAMLLRFNWM